MIEKAKTLLLSLTPIALMYIIQIAAALGGQILIIWANQFMAMAHVYQSPVLQYAVDQYVYIVSAASYGLFFSGGILLVPQDRGRQACRLSGERV
ncbi:hypothetical protein AB9D59_08700 [Blautia producta]|uniref:hypothetical protein n=1 Tax=Blautia producta TaxID=33035 RepID=UPI0035BE4FD3